MYFRFTCADSSSAVPCFHDCDLRAVDASDEAALLALEEQEEDAGICIKI